MSNLLIPVVSGTDISSTAQNTAYDQIENSFSDLGPFIITGLVHSAGAGLAVSVTAGTAIIGGRVTKASTFSISGLTDASVNDIYLLQNGTGTSLVNPSTQPANSVLLGTATTAAGVVSSVNTTRSSGRQLKVRTESLVPGGPGAGNPASINLANWAAAAANSVSVFGTLPAGAMTTAPLTLTVDDASGSAITRALNLRHTNSGGAGAAGIGTGVQLEVESTTSTVVTAARIDTDTSNASAAGLTANLYLRVAEAGAIVTPLTVGGTLLTLASAVNIAVGTATGTKFGTSTAQKIGFWNAVPVVQPAAYVQTYATANRTFSAYTSDPESGAYTGIDNAQGATPYATVADLNALRVAYEALRVFAENVGALVNSLIDDHQSIGLAS